MKTQNKLARRIKTLKHKKQSAKNRHDFKQVKVISEQLKREQGHEWIRY